MTNQTEQPFEDGNVSAVVRIGDTVRRSSGPWTPAVHALLRHLERAGFSGATRVLGMDAQGREILSYIDGVTIPSTLEGFRQEAVLVDAARLLRRYHDAAATFVPPADAAWRFSVGAPRAGEVICHNDIAPWNMIMQQGQAAAFIDWDFAAPGPREWDIAYALWRFTPLYDEETFGPPEERARRMNLFCTAYGLEVRGGMLEMTRRRMLVLYESLKTWAAEGIPAFAAMWRDGHGDGMLRDIAYLDQHRAVLAAGLG